MKNKARKVRNLIPLLILVWALMWLVDNLFNGVVGDWFIINFVSYYDGPNGAVNSDINWVGFRDFLISSFLIATVILYIANQFYINVRMRKEKAQIQEDVLHILQYPERSHLTSEYAHIEAEILRIQMENKKQQELLEKETERKNDLITYLAHDLKTPLASVLGYLNFLSEAQELPLQQRQKYTDIALEKAQRLETLINQFFDITRFNLHSIVLQKEPVHLNLMLEQLSSEFYPALQEKNCAVVIRNEVEQPIYVDPDQFGRVLNNVMKNAVAYSYADSTIDIHAYRKEQQVLIAIQNQGNQIPEAKLMMIFEKFFRMDEARSTNAGGAGLGLAIAKEIVEAHQGTIVAASDETGTTFTVQLPLQSAEVASKKSALLEKQ